MTEADLDFLRGFLKRRSGLDLGPDKRYLLESRLRPVWSGAGLPSLAALVEQLRGAAHPRLGDAVAAAMTTNETLFFRDRALFETIRSVVLPRLLESPAGARRLRIWSAACSTGQEAYSLAMILADMNSRLSDCKIEILGTDLSPQAVARAQEGTYTQLEVQRGLPIRALLRHFSQTTGGWRIAAPLRNAVSFRVFNLMDDLGALGRFDLVLCRNLLIYLDRQTKADLLSRLAATLAPETGLLCLGASETALGLHAELTPDPDTLGFYRRGGKRVELPHDLRRAG